MITRMTFGPYEGKYVCMLPCAYVACVNFYTETPRPLIISTLPELKYHTPTEDLAQLGSEVSMLLRCVSGGRGEEGRHAMLTFADTNLVCCIFLQIVANTHKKVAIWKTAGGGKTDFVAMLTALCRADQKASAAACLNTDARDEMYVRGLSTLEAHNWHAFEKRNLEIKLQALLQYEQSESDPVNKYDKMRLVLEPCNAKTRLLLRIAIAETFDEPLRLPLHKVYVEFVVQLVRCVRAYSSNSNTAVCVLTGIVRHMHVPG